MRSQTLFAIAFYFVFIRFSTVSSYNEYSKNMIEAVKSMLRTRLSLKEALAFAGEVFTLDDVWDVDLSLDKLTSDSFAFLTAPSEHKIDTFSLGEDGFKGV